MLKEIRFSLAVAVIRHIEAQARVRRKDESDAWLHLDHLDWLSLSPLVPVCLCLSLFLCLSFHSFPHSSMQILETHGFSAVGVIGLSRIKRRMKRVSEDYCAREQRQSGSKGAATLPFLAILGQAVRRGAGSVCTQGAGCIITKRTFNKWLLQSSELLQCLDDTEIARISEPFEVPLEGAREILPRTRPANSNCSMCWTLIYRENCRRSPGRLRDYYLVYPQNPNQGLTRPSKA